jgi:GT2 family glycosyltransferase
MTTLRDGNRVAVLVLNRDGAHFLHDCFQSLLENKYPPFDIYLVDNHSIDSSVALTSTHYPMVKIIRNEANLGFAGAYDRVIRRLDYKYVVLLNNDTVVDEKWLGPLFDAAERDPLIAACGSKILMMWDRSVIDHAGGMLTMIGSGIDLGKWTRDQRKFDRTRQVGFGCGCALLIRRKAYLEVGGFDPDYLIYHEDVDLCWRFRLFGYSVLYVADSVVYHHVGGGKIQSVDENPFRVYLCQKNRLANVIKNFGVVSLLKALVVSTVYDLLRTLRFLYAGRTDLLSALLNGYGATFRNIRRVLRQRLFVQRQRVLSDAAVKGFFSPLMGSILNYRRMIRAQGNAPKAQERGRKMI